jgi:hypothetical protein
MELCLGRVVDILSVLFPVHIRRFGGYAEMLHDGL